MPAFNLEALAGVQSACEATAIEAADAFSRAFDQKIQLRIGAGGPFDTKADLPEFAQPGLAIVLKVNDQAALVMLPEASGLLPDWYLEPDPTGESKLSTLGQELGMTLLPEEFMAMEFEVGDVDDLAVACQQGQLGEAPAKLRFVLESNGRAHDALMVWPIVQAEAVLKPAAPQQTPAQAAAAATASTDGGGRLTSPPRINGFRELPTYSRSLLHIEVPIRVILASKAMKVNEIVNMGIGTIIQFDKSCEDTLDVEIGKQKIAEGEAVKIGDKFGVRVTNIAMPEERYIALKARKRVR